MEKKSVETKVRKLSFITLYLKVVGTCKKISIDILIKKQIIIALPVVKE